MIEKPQFLSEYHEKKHYINRQLEISWSNLELYIKRTMRPEWQDHMTSLRNDIEKEKNDIMWLVYDKIKLQDEQDPGAYDPHD